MRWWHGQPLLERLFPAGLRERPTPERWFLRSLQLIFIAGRKFQRDLCFERAAALAFTTAVCLVPAGILFFALIRLVAGTGELRGELILRIHEFLSEYVSEAGREQVERNLDTLLSSIERQSSGVEWAAIFFLVVAVLSLYRSAEGTFAALWNVQTQRAFHRKLVSFWLLLTAAPLFLAISLWAQARLSEQLGGVAQWLFPVLIALAAFSLVIIYLPHTHVRPWCGITGALAAAIGWQLATQAFSFYVQNAVLSGVYGALGVVPFFLLWVYISWWTALAGAELAYCLQHFRLLEREIRFQLDHERTPPPVLGLLAMERVFQGQRAGEAVDADIIAGDFSLPLSEVEGAVETLVEARVLARDEDGMLTPRRAPETLSPLEIVQLFPTSNAYQLPTGLRGIHDTPVARLVGEISDQIDEILARGTFAVPPGGPVTKPYV